MPMTPLEASTLCLFHAEAGFANTGSRRAAGVQGYSFGTVALSSAQSKFGAQSLDLMNANFASLMFPGCGPVVNGATLSMDCWAYYRSHRAGVGNFMVLMQGVGAAGTSYFRLRTTAGGIPTVDAKTGDAGMNSIAGPSALPVNQWVHLAATMSAESQTRRLYVNGVMVAAGNGIPFPLIEAPTGDFRLGPYAGGGEFPPDAYADEARYVFGQPVYELPFDVPSVALPDGGTLHLHGDGANAGMSIIDSSPNALAATQSGTSGNVTTSTSNYRLGGSSLRFGGTHGLTYAASALFEAASRDWTVECFFTLDNVATPMHLWEFGTSQTRRFSLFLDTTLKRLGFYSQTTSGDGATRCYSTVISPNTWYHVAVTRESKMVTLWLNGEPVATSAYDPPVPTGNLQLTIGKEPFFGDAQYHLSGNIDEFRVTMGEAVYKLNFTPPTAPYADVASDPSFSAPAGLKFGAKLTMAQPTPSVRACANPVLVRDVDHGGAGKIPGTLEVDSTPDYPVVRKLWLLRQRDAKVIRETWSDVAGVYQFSGIDPSQKYAVIAFDHTGVFNAVIADNLTPEPM